MSQDLDFNASLEDAISPVIEAIQAQVETLTETVAAASEEIDASFSAATDSVTAAAEGMTEAGATTDELSASIASLTEALLANTDALSANTDSMAADTDAKNANSAANDSNAAGVQQFNMALLGAGVVIAGVGIASVKMAGDFQSGITTLVTGAGESKKNIDLISKGILNLANSTGESTNQLISGMFMIESAGYHGSDALNVLKAAAEGAKVGNADLGTVADATTTILNDFGNTGITASNAVNELVATVSNGKTHMQDLGQALAQILPTASALHVGLQDVMGAMATMTSEGTPAAQAATYLRQTLMALDNPSKKAQATLREFGLSSEEVATEMQKSLPDALKMITDAVGKKFPATSPEYAAAIATIAGGTKTMQGIFKLTGDHLKTFQNDVTGIAGSVKSAGNHIQGWGEIQGDFNQKMSIAKEHVETFMIQIGQHLLPALSQMADVFSTDVMPAITQFAQFLEEHKSVLTAVAAVLAGVVVAALWSLVAPLGAAVVAAMPLIAVFAGIAVVVAEVATHWGEITEALKPFMPLFAEIKDIVMAVFHALQDSLNDALVQLRIAWQQIQPPLQQIWQSLMALQPVFEAIAAVVGGLVVTAIGVMIGAINGIIGALHGVVEYFAGFMTTLRGFFDIIVGIFTGNGTLIQQGIHELVSGVEEMFKGMIDTVTGFVMGFVNGIVGWFQHLFDALIGHSIIPDMIAAILRAFAQLGADALNAIKSMIQLMLGALAALPGDMLKIGENIVNGIVNGIEGAAGNAEKAVQNLGSNLLGSLGNLLGIHSPSSVFAEHIGKPIADGIALGITQHAGHITDALANATTGAMTTTSGAVHSGSAAMGLQYGAQAAAPMAGGATHHTITIQFPNGSGDILKLLDPVSRSKLLDGISQELDKRFRMQGGGARTYTGGV